MVVCDLKIAGLSCAQTALIFLPRSSFDQRTGLSRYITSHCSYNVVWQSTWTTNWKGIGTEAIVADFKLSLQRLPGTEGKPGKPQSKESHSQSWDPFHTKQTCWPLYQCSACVLPCLYVPVSTNVLLFRVGWLRRNQFKIPTSSVLVLSHCVHLSMSFALICRSLPPAVGILVKPTGRLAQKFAACCRWMDFSPACV